MIQYLRNCLKGKVVKSTAKKVLIVRFDRETLVGFVQTPGGFQFEALELLTPEGTLIPIPYSETKAVCFVRDFESAESWRPHRAYATRPKSAGLWVRLRFRDGDSIEGMLPNNLLLGEPTGFSVVPPDPTFQNQRIFVPRTALNDIQVLGVIGSPLRKRTRKPAPDATTQIEMFE
jgi:uncharacterized protein DUF6982